MTDPGEAEAFELEMLGGGTERRYRAARPEVEAMPWGTLDLAAIPPRVLHRARVRWTMSAFQEHRTGAQCAATLRALFECRAPIDLVACFARFPVDEAVHVELCARLASELGGPASLVHTRNDLARDYAQDRSALLRAAEYVVRTFCVGEPLSIPLLHAAWQDAEPPLVRAILGRIVRDEAAHGTVGWTFLDWADGLLTDADRAYLTASAHDEIAAVNGLWSWIRKRHESEATPRDGLGWIGDVEYLALAAKSMRERVIAPLFARGIDVRGSA